jgi:hypothetical protein
MQACIDHTVSALQRGWSLPTIDFGTDDASQSYPSPMTLYNLHPYWMSRTHSVPNTVNLQGVVLLTAPNMAGKRKATIHQISYLINVLSSPLPFLIPGKSTLMRSTLVAALLGNCGMFVPCQRALMPRYSSFFLRTSSFDIPLEGKSSLATELDDVRVMMRDSNRHSLLLLDELGERRLLPPSLPPSLHPFPSSPPPSISRDEYFSLLNVNDI